MRVLGVKSQAGPNLIRSRKEQQHCDCHNRLTIDWYSGRSSGDNPTPSLTHSHNRKPGALSPAIVMQCGRARSAATIGLQTCSGDLTSLFAAVTTSPTLCPASTTAYSTLLSLSSVRLTLCRSSPCNLTHSLSLTASKQQLQPAASGTSPVTPFVLYSPSQPCSPAQHSCQLSTATPLGTPRHQHGSACSRQQHRHSAALQHLPQETKLQRYQPSTYSCSKQAASQQLLQVEGSCGH